MKDFSSGECITIQIRGKLLPVKVSETAIGGEKGLRGTSSVGD